LRELEVLFALCKAAPLLNDVTSAQKLTEQLSPYLLEAHVQSITPSPFLRDIEPSPWESLTSNLTSALLSIGAKHKSLRPYVLEKLSQCLENCRQSLASRSSLQSRVLGVESHSETDEEDIARIASVTVSLLGFLDSAAQYADVWTAPERLALVNRLDSILSQEVLISVESAFSTIRSSHQSSHSDFVLKEWKRYTKHYAAIGRPLGAMLLQQGFGRFMTASTSLLVADPAHLREKDVLDLLMSEDEEGRVDYGDEHEGDAGFETIEEFATLAAKQMEELEDGADYLQLGTAWQQRLAFSVKAYVLIIYTNCVVLDDSVADPDVLVNWLEETMADPIQMADETLVSVVLKCYAVMATLTSTYAANLSRSIPRYLVRGGARGQMADVAAGCLSVGLRNLSPDATITTLYTLGNVLSSGSKSELTTNTADTPAGSSISRANGLRQQHATGSSISLALSGEEETAVVYGNIVRAIVIVASRCKDDKIVALAQSMLLQKIGKVSVSVDAEIITEAAALVNSGAQVEFRSLLKGLARLSHDAALKTNVPMLSAVSFINNLFAGSICTDNL
jgi:phosphatidylinositol 4-kinase A